MLPARPNHLDSCTGLTVRLPNRAVATQRNFQVPKAKGWDVQRQSYFCGPFPSTHQVMCFWVRVPQHGSKANQHEIHCCPKHISGYAMSWNPDILFSVSPCLWAMFFHIDMTCTSNAFGLALKDSVGSCSAYSDLPASNASLNQWTRLSLAKSKQQCYPFKRQLFPSKRQLFLPLDGLRSGRNVKCSFLGKRRCFFGKAAQKRLGVFAKRPKNPGVDSRFF